ncbi:hypothetical protein Tsubulata_012423 [Turnera subulata]|uniref:Uncharacterized protein n=1 Tax=Turnera subulata TaxID=218843 RepID=A0A9Q0JQJ7_9ROSI|nr:hypothetical protein Tsubulata_012423 [Turnera subulata]
MKASEISSPATIISVNSSRDMITTKPLKPAFRPAQDDTKPPLQDPILRSDPTESEEAVMRLPAFALDKSKSRCS